MFCRYCGAKLEEGAVFCTSCGKPTETRVEQPGAYTASSAGGQTGIGKMVLFMCVGIVCSVLYSFFSGAGVIGYVTEILSAFLGCLVIFVLYRRGRIYLPKVHICACFVPVAIYLMRSIIAIAVRVLSIETGNIALMSWMYAVNTDSLVGLGGAWVWLLSILYLVKQSYFKRSTKPMLPIIVAVMIVLDVLLFFMPVPILRIFSSDPAVIDLASRCTRILTLYMTVLRLIALGAIYLITWIFEKNRAVVE